jgi:hypothetical protein
MNLDELSSYEGDLDELSRAMKCFAMSLLERLLEMMRPALFVPHTSAA